MEDDYICSVTFFEECMKKRNLFSSFILSKDIIALYSYFLHDSAFIWYSSVSCVSMQINILL